MGWELCRWSLRSDIVRAGAWSGGKKIGRWRQAEGPVWREARENSAEAKRLGEQPVSPTAPGGLAGAALGRWKVERYRRGMCDNGLKGLGRKGGREARLRSHARCYPTVHRPGNASIEYCIATTRQSGRRRDAERGRGVSRLSRAQRRPPPGRPRPGHQRSKSATRQSAISKISRA